jgi:hypothetical protein
MHYHPNTLLALHEERQLRLETKARQHNRFHALRRRRRWRWRRRNAQPAFIRNDRALQTNADAA